MGGAHFHRSTSLDVHENLLVVNRDTFGVLVCSCTSVKSLSAVNGTARSILTLHVSFPLVHDERVTLALAFTIRDQSYSLNVAVDFKLSSEILLGDFLRLDSVSFQAQITTIQFEDYSPISK